MYLYTLNEWLISDGFECKVNLPVTPMDLYKCFFFTTLWVRRFFSKLFPKASRGRTIQWLLAPGSGSGGLTGHASGAGAGDE